MIGCACCTGTLRLSSHPLEASHVGAEHLWTGWAGAAGAAFTLRCWRQPLRDGNSAKSALLCPIL